MPTAAGIPTPPPFVRPNVAPQAVAPQFQPVPQAPQFQPVPQAPVAAPHVPQAQAPVAAPQGVKPSASEPRDRSTAKITDANSKYVIDNITTTPYKELAAKTGLSKNQVNTIIQRARTDMRNVALQRGQQENVLAYEVVPGQTMKDGAPKYNWDNPLTPFAQQIEQLIKQKLSRPDSAGGGRGAGTNEDVFNNRLNELLSEIM